MCRLRSWVTIWIQHAPSRAFWHTFSRSFSSSRCLRLLTTLVLQRSILICHLGRLDCRSIATGTFNFFLLLLKVNVKFVTENWFESWWDSLLCCEKFKVLSISFTVFQTCLHELTWEFCTLTFYLTLWLRSNLSISPSLHVPNPSIRKRWTLKHFLNLERRKFFIEWHTFINFHIIISTRFSLARCKIRNRLTTQFK